MKIQLVDRNKLMCNEWANQFHNIPNVIIHNGDFFSLPATCIVSPANSFGFMDGGLDAVISRKLGQRTQEKLQKIISEEFHGELLVGQAVLIETEFPEIPYCISAPTMRVPLILKGAPNVYLAAKAVFRILINNPYLEAVTISGMGTGVGNVPEPICAQQMRKAFDEIFLGNKKAFKTLKEAQEHHIDLITLKQK